MSKKTILLTWPALSMAAFALPGSAIAAEEDVALHLIPQPVGAKPVHGVGSATIQGGSWAAVGTVVCPVSSGSATFTSTTTGTLVQTFGANVAGQRCNIGGVICTGEGQPAGSGIIKTTTLEFHLATAVDTVNGATGPGVLVTPGKDPTGLPHYATFSCGIIGTKVVRGSLVGTITKPKCGEESNEATLQFSSSSTGVETHKTIVNNLGGHTPTEYNLTEGGSAVSEDWEGTITLGSKAKLDCT
jgi:hypothetical protein